MVFSALLTPACRCSFHPKGRIIAGRAGEPPFLLGSPLGIGLGAHVTLSLYRLVRLKDVGAMMFDGLGCRPISNIFGKAGAR